MKLRQRDEAQFRVPRVDELERLRDAVALDDLRLQRVVNAERFHRLDGGGPVRRGDRIGDGDLRRRHRRERVELRHHVGDLGPDVPDREAVVCGDRRITFGELDQRADRLAHVLAAYRIGVGDAVAISLTNRPEYLETFFVDPEAGRGAGEPQLPVRRRGVGPRPVRLRGPAAVVFHVDVTDRVTDAVALLDGAPDPLLLAVDGDYEHSLGARPEGPPPRAVAAVG